MLFFYQTSLNPPELSGQPHSFNSNDTSSVAMIFIDFIASGCNGLINRLCSEG
ncbi:hypothetical protein IMPR6_200027 [Imperialibacter sp. EC-SDR9]|nr:hypothetical protein IMPERIA75_180028 [Imperialibacter sp. 75]CAD5298145.1 hypothetical protein IMPERIA89_730027 [Imperialibacter sp. 89]VVT13386.1 hypothetical protein IMPR6_200027 [Imperialibacter sp. EC-SDR9]